LHAGFGFDAAASIADYLHRLGISHVYSSPYLQAAPGSQHGYDVVDPHRVNDELGGSEAHDRFSVRLCECQLGQVLDIVPNHMAISGGRRNRYWWDVLENGPSSRYSTYFDIDWQPREEKLRNKLLVPILGDNYGRALERGEIQLQRRGGEFFVRYFDHELPASPKSLPSVLASAASETGSDYLGFLADSLARLPRATLTDRASIAERHRNKRIVSDLLERLFHETPFIAEAVDNALNQVNGNPDRLDAVLELQNYRLAFWRTAKQELGYRRFFDVNTLVGLRMESPQVFADTHAVILRWLREGVLDGIRIDHPDGLLDPRQYFDRLRSEASDVWILAEKIIEPGERFRSEWPIDGTTGYDFLNQAGGLFVDSSNEEAMTKIYAEFTGEPTDYAAICREKKHLVMRDLLGSDVNRLTNLLAGIFEVHRERRDYTRRDGSRAIRELIACFPVYRTYVVPERNEIGKDDITNIEKAVACAKSNRPELDPDLFDFIRDILLLRERGPLESEFVLRFQQFAGPVMAKGVEDTVFYCYNRLVALNEVGGDPGRFGVSPRAFHHFCADVHRHRPRTMLASSTHDTKRSEDVRARISLLSELPEVWRAAVTRWSANNAKYKKDRCLDPGTEYLIYQSMLGAWPIDTDRLLPYVEKAAREAKRKTSWLEPNEQFESAMREFVEALYRDEIFLRDFEHFVQPLIEPGRINSLSLALLKLTAPGIPDLYQGSELWDLSLVDPDNRRPVDYDLRRRLLCEILRLDVKQVWSRMDEGLPKLWTTYHALRVRRQHPDCFAERGGYMPFRARGPKAAHVVAYLRGASVLAVAPRLIVKLASKWGDTTLKVPEGNWKNELSGQQFTGGEVKVSDLLDAFPVALLLKQ
jgi:(1->4)-alpha-D-glucan 1-alpha-D-glucosylmutase